jgi:hypothetical protein
MVTQALNTESPADAATGPPVALMPEDAALYVCGCGDGFTAAVTTCAICPDAATAKPGSAGGQPERPRVAVNTAGAVRAP